MIKRQMPTKDSDAIKSTMVHLFFKKKNFYLINTLNSRTCFVGADGLFWITIKGGTGSCICDNPTDLRIIALATVPYTSVNTKDGLILSSSFIVILLRTNGSFTFTVRILILIAIPVLFLSSSWQL